MLALATPGCHFQGREGGKGVALMETVLGGGDSGPFLPQWQASYGWGPDARGVPTYTGSPRRKTPLLYWNAKSVLSHMLCPFRSRNRVLQGSRLRDLSQP